MAAVAFTAIGLLAGCGGSDDESAKSASGDASAASKKLTLNTWGGAYQEAQEKAIVAPAGQQGFDVTVTHPIDYAKLKAMVEADNVVWDVADVEPFVSMKGCEEGWLEKLDFNVIDRSRFLPSMKTTDCSVPNGAFSVAINYRTDKFPDAHPMNWADFFDTQKFPGKRAMLNYAQSGVLEAALLADGVSKEDLYPLDYERAFKKLDTIKKDIVWAESGDQSSQLMSSGEVSLCACWVTRMNDSADKGAPIAVEWQDHIYGWDDFVVPKGAKNGDAAMQFIEFATSPEQEIAMTKYTPWGPSDKEAASKPDAATIDWIPTTPQHVKLGVPIDYEWWTPNADKLNEAFSQWLLG
jgi:putative spermidine/putrescine transport system substrate-binding protein